MGKVTLDITMSLDGFVAAPSRTLEEPLGEGGERLHDWVFGLASWRAAHGLEGGEASADSELVEQGVAATGAVIMGRRMFSGGEGPWADDPNAGGWWGDEPPFGVPVFVLTHHAREPVELRGGTSFTFVTGGIEPALAQAREAAGERNVAIAGGAEVVQQFLRAGVVDELHIHVAPVLLGGGVLLLDGVGPGLELEQLPSPASPNVAHLRYRVVR